MKDKLLDLGLLTALIIVALLVGITLYGSGLNFKGFTNKNPIVQTNPSSGDTISTSNSIETNNSNSSTDVQVINPNNPNPSSEANSQNASDVATDTNVVTVAPIPATDTSNSAQSTNNTETQTPEVEVVSAPLPEGSFELQSIGFSYVTGGSGACGVTLEAWKHVAVSRDILAKYPCGSEITINIDKPIAGHSSFKAIVGDTMNKKHTKTVNIYVAKDEPALEYGRQEGSLVP